MIQSLALVNKHPLQILVKIKTVEKQFRFIIRI